MHLTAFDAIVMDVRMPKMDGLQAARRLRAEGVTAAIIALTADAVTAQRTECLNAGCTAFLSEPIDIAALVAQIANCASARTSRR